MKKIYAVQALYGEEFEKLEARQEEFLFNKESFMVPWDDDEEDNGKESRNYQVVNGLALYDIKGKMLASGNFFTQIFGIATYDVIANDFAQMAADDEVEKVLIHADTPGGSVSGISDVSDAWSKLNSMKPITVHTPGTLASAGVWLTSNSDKIYASEVAEVGSVGVIMQHISYQKMLEDDGIKVTQIKSSEKKAIGSPAKDLTSSDIEYLQKKVMETNELFRKQLYRTRPMISPEAFDGGTFSANEALRLGLIDGVETYSNVFEQLLASLDDDSGNNKYNGGQTMKRKVTAEMAQAAISNGADPEALEIISQEAYDALPDTEKGILTDEEEQTMDNDGNDDDSQQSSEELVAEIEGLTVQLTAANEEVETLAAKVKELGGELEARQSDPLRKIAEDRIMVMRNSFGLTKMDMSEFTTNSLLTEYNALDKQFKKAFKSGGHTTTKTEAPKGEKVVHMDNARLGAVGLD